MHKLIDIPDDRCGKIIKGMFKKQFDLDLIISIDVQKKIYSLFLDEPFGIKESEMKKYAGFAKTALSAYDNTINYEEED